MQCYITLIHCADYTTLEWNTTFFKLSCVVTVLPPAEGGKVVNVWKMSLCAFALFFIIAFHCFKQRDIPAILIINMHARMYRCLPHGNTVVDTR